VLHVDLEVVLQVLAHAGQVVHHVDAERAQLVGRSDPRDLQQLGRVDGPAAEHHLARPHRAPAAPGPGVLDAHRAPALEQDPRGQGERLDLEVGTAHHRVQVGPRGRQPAPVVHVAVEGREALLAVAVDVLGERIAGLLHGREERVE
jgi:hypothetical protein